MQAERAPRAEHDEHDDDRLLPVRIVATPADVADLIVAERTLIVGWCRQCAECFTGNELGRAGAVLGDEDEVPRVWCPKCQQGLVALRPQHELMADFVKLQQRRRLN